MEATRNLPKVDCGFFINRYMNIQIGPRYGHIKAQIGTDKTVDYEELFAKYQVLLRENSNLKSENKRLKVQLGIVEQQTVVFDYAVAE